MNKKRVLIILSCIILINIINISAFNFEDPVYGLESEVPEVIFDNNTAFVNSTEIWVTNIGDLDNANATQFSNGNGVLNILESWLTTFGNTLWLSLNQNNWFNDSLGWINWDGDSPEFNGTFLNFTIQQHINSTTYLPCAFAIEEGTGSGNNNLGNLSFYDGETFNVSEDAGAAPVLTVNVTFCNVTSFDSINTRTLYMGGQGHEIWIQLWDFTNAAWESYSLPITDQATLTEISPIGVTDAVANHINASNNVMFRFWHEQNGIASHELLIDYVNLVENPIAITTIEHDSLSGRGNVENHPWALPTDGSRTLTGQWNFGSFGIVGADNITTTADMDMRDLYVRRSVRGNLEFFDGDNIIMGQGSIESGAGTELEFAGNNLILSMKDNEAFYCSSINCDSGTSGDPWHEFFGIDLDIENIDINGSVVTDLNLDEQLVFTSKGTATNPAMIFFPIVPDPDAGFYQVGSDNWGWSGGGKIRFDLSNFGISSINGSVGFPAISFLPAFTSGMGFLNSNLLLYNQGGIGINITPTAIIMKDFLSIGNNGLEGLSAGDINASTIYYDTLTQKSPIIFELDGGYILTRDLGLEWVECNPKIEDDCPIEAENKMNRIYQQREDYTNLQIAIENCENNTHSYSEEQGCYFDEPKAQIICLRKEPYNYFDGNCKEDPQLKCIYNETTDWIDGNCEINEIKSCEVQEDMIWNKEEEKCEFNQEKKDMRIMNECADDRTILFEDCLNDNGLIF